MKEDVLDIEIDENEKEDSKFKKFIIVLGGILLVILIVSYIFTSFPIGRILRGQLESNPLEEGVIIIEDLAIIFEDGTDELLQEIYLSEQEVEFSVCLIGEKVGKEYHITSLYQPEQTASFSHVSFESCSSETLIMLHSHPYKSCLASETDLETLERSQKENEDLLMVVMCESSRFSVYS